MLKSLLIATLAAIVTAIPAHADKGPAGDNPEDNFLFVLHSAGITPGSHAVEGGLGLCSNISRGVKPRSLMAEVAKLSPELSSVQAETVVDSAVVWLCPQFIAAYLRAR